MRLLNNYTKDLLKSRTTPLLLELTKKDLDLMCKDDTCGVKISLVLAKKLYDTPLKNISETNLIFIDTDNVKDYKHTFLLEEFLTLIVDQIETIKNLNIIKETISTGLSFATAGLLKESMGSFIDSSIDLITETINSDIMDLLADRTFEHLDVGKKITDILESEIFDILSGNSINFLESIKKNTLYLSPNSKKALKDLSKHFKEELTPAESFRFILQLILSVAIEMPTLLYVKNPHKLDRDSLAILSLLFSFSKDVKDLGKHTNLSVVYAYEDEKFQPYLEVDDKYKESKRLLDEQRLYTQRYSMLERPTSDIPHIAVKSSVFVGRKEELLNLNSRYQYSKEHKNIATIETISGEPGIGKTKLVKKHLEQIRQENSDGAKGIQLTLLNQVGHASSNTGLASLTEAIVKEATRLENLKIFHKNMTDKTKNYMFESIVDGVKSTLGVDAIINIGTAVTDRIFLDGQLERSKLNTTGNLDEIPRDKKQKQFINLRIAIEKLRELSNTTMPIVLFIDDLQWIDEDSSEFVLQHIIKNFNIHIVATIRPSDSLTVLKKAYENKRNNPYRIALFKKVKIKLYKNDLSEIKQEITIESDIDTSILEFKATHLLGLDILTLISLISEVIKPIDNDESKQNILAKTIVENFEDKNAKGTANTLFAVETINMLCDKKLYSQNSIDIKDQLIVASSSFIFNPEIVDFQLTLENTFTILHEKYKIAFEHINAEQEGTEFKQKFNLMAYAVLEERLKILKIYFAEYGSAAVNTLLFSSLLGTPFNSIVVKNILESISTTEDKLLEPLKKYILEGKDEISLSEAHYEIIEEVYEILSKYISFNSSYEYRHSLLNIFLEQQLEYQLDNIFECNTMNAKDKLYLLILKKIDEESQKYEFTNKEEHSLLFTEYNLKLSFQKFKLNVEKKGYKNNSQLWSNSYGNTLNTLAISYRKKSNYLDSLDFFDLALSINQVSNNIRYTSIIEKSLCLFFIGDYYNSKKNILDIIGVDEGIINNDLLAEAYFVYAEINRRLGSYSIALDYYNKSIKLYGKELLQIAKAKGYMGIINRSIGNYKEAKKLYLESLKIRKEENDLQGIGYVYGLLGNLMYDLNNIDDAIKYNTLSREYRIKVNDKIGIVDTYRDVSRIFLLDKNFKLALESAILAYDKSLSIESKAIKFNTLIQLSTVYKTKDIHEARKYYNEARALVSYASKTNQIEFYQIGIYLKENSDIDIEHNDWIYYVNQTLKLIDSKYHASIQRRWKTYFSMINNGLR